MTDSKQAPREVWVRRFSEDNRHWDATGDAEIASAWELSDGSDLYVRADVAADLALECLLAGAGIGETRADAERADMPIPTVRELMPADLQRRIAELESEP